MDSVFSVADQPLKIKHNVIARSASDVGIYHCLVDSEKWLVDSVLAESHSTLARASELASTSVLVGTTGFFSRVAHSRSSGSPRIAGLFYFLVLVELPVLLVLIKLLRDSNGGAVAEIPLKIKHNYFGNPRNK